MNRRILQNDELDRLGRKLLDAGRVRNEEIERIVASPMLFEKVKAKIENERRRQNPKSVFGGWASVQIWSWQNITAAFLLLFIVGAIGLIGVNKFNGRREQFDRAATAREIQPELKQNEILHVSPTIQTPEDSPVVVKTKIYADASPKIVKRKVFADKASKARKPNHQQKIQLEQNKSAGEFYALTFTENTGEAAEELRIVRAEFSRSSLFALGVNLPIENESEKIKTDLLVGADGVARAIRLVD